MRSVGTAKGDGNDHGDGLDGLCCAALRCCRSSLLADNLQLELLLLAFLLLLSRFLFIGIADY